MRRNSTIYARRFSTALALLTALIIGLGPASSAAQTFKMKIATINRGDSIFEWMDRLGTRIQEKSEGRIAVEKYPGGQLGLLPRMIEGLQLGTIEAFPAPAANFVGVDERFQVTAAPGWFTDMQHVWRTIQDPRFRDVFLSLAESKGLKGVSLFIYGPVHYASRNPIRSIDDFKNLKVRVAASKIQEVAQEKLGATGVSIIFSELWPALQRGTVDAARLEVSLFALFKAYDVVKYVTLTEEAVFVTIGFASKKWFDKLPSDLQQVVLTEGKAIEAELTELGLQRSRNGEKEWQSHGGEIIRFSAEERARMRERLAPVPEEVFKDKPQVMEMYQLLKTVAAAHE